MKRTFYFLIALLGFVKVMAADDIALFMPAPASGSELSLETRSKFFLHLNKFLDWVTSFQNFSYEKASFLKEITNPFEPISEFEKKHGFFATQSPLVGQYTPLKSDVEYVQSLLNLIDQAVIPSENRKFYIQEVLSKVLAYRHLEIADTLVIPDFNVPGEASTYRIETIFDLGLSMPAYAFTTSDPKKPAILIYRGTHFDLTHKSGIASIIADLDLYGPGYTAFFKIESQLKAFLMSQSLKGKKTIVLGYSLGGALALYTGVFFKDYLDIPSSCAFNPPGVQKKLLKLCQSSKIVDDFQVYVNNSDPVSKWGFLIGLVDILTVDQRMGPLEAHTMLMSALSDLDFFRCNLKLENERHHSLFNWEQ